MKLRALRAQIGAETRMTLERGETLLVTIGIPVVLLVFFSLVPVLPTGTRHRVDFLAPGVLALAVMSTAMVSLGIATAFERSYGVLKRLGVNAARSAGAARRPRSPRSLVVEIAQVVVLVAVALALGWRPHAAAGLAVIAVLLATIAFAGIGLAMAGALRAEVTLAVANGVYVILLLIGGVLFPLNEARGLASFARLLPTAALSDALHPTLGAGASVPLEAWVVLARWAVAAPVVAAFTFKWE